MSLKSKVTTRKFGLSIIVLALTITAFLWGKAKYDDWTAFPFKLRAYEDARLGETKDEAFMILGSPQLVQGPLATDKTGKITPSPPLRVEKWQDKPFMTELLKSYDVMPEGANIQSYDTWRYVLSPMTGKTYSITFDKSGAISSIECNSNSNSCDKILGIEIYTPEDQVRYLLGEPDQELVSENGSGKKIVYRTLGLTFALEHERVTSITKFAPREVNFIWWLRHGMLK